MFYPTWSGSPSSGQEKWKVIAYRPFHKKSKKQEAVAIKEDRRELFCSVLFSTESFLLVIIDSTEWWKKSHVFWMSGTGVYQPMSAEKNWDVGSYGFRGLCWPNGEHWKEKNVFSHSFCASGRIILNSHSPCSLSQPQISVWEPRES